MTKVFSIILTMAFAMLANIPLAAAGADRSSVEISIDSIQMLVGQQTGLHVSAIVKPGQKVKFATFRPEQMLAPGLEVVNSPVIDTADADGGFIKVTQHLVLTAWEDSLFYIPGQKIIIDGKAQQTKNLALKVLTIDVDTLHPNQFFGPKEVQDNPFAWDEWAEVFWFSILAMVLYLLCWLAYLRLKSNKPIQLRVRIRKIIPPHQRALNAIDEIKQGASHSTTKDYYTQLTDTLRLYIEERFGFSAMEMTSAEIIARLREEGDQQKINELTMLFETADLVKFAKYEAGMSENDRNLVSAVDFINITKQENLPTEERIEPTVTEQQRQTIRMRLSLKWAMAFLIILATAAATYVCWLMWDMMN